MVVPATNRYLAGLLRACRLLLDWLSDLLWGRLLCQDHRPLPPISDVLLLDTASALADKIRTGKVTSEQVVQVYKKRAEEVNGILNCYVDTR